MSESYSPDQPLEPWKDTPSDDAEETDAMEPSPAEVVDEERGIDISEPPFLNPSPAQEYGRDTLDERLREEEPDPALEEPGEFREAGAPQRGIRVGEPADLGGRDVTKDEVAGPVDSATGDLGAEDEAVHEVEEEE